MQYQLIKSESAWKLVYDIGVESVILFLKNNKVTVCVSSQVGCNHGCLFCRTGTIGMKRNLTTEELVQQYLDIRSLVPEITSIVYMGMGEPLDNYDAVVESIRILNEKHFVSYKKITVSTCGVSPKIKTFLHESKARIAISLNATDNKTRSRLMPINKIYPIETIIDALKQSPNSRYRPVMVEYVCIKGINDSPEQVNKISEVFKGISIVVNLIPFNSHDKSDFASTDYDDIFKIKQNLISQDIKVFIRENIGNEIMAACGTLGSMNLK